MREIVIDTETTGLNHKAGDRIVEVGCVSLLITLQQTKHYNFIVRSKKKCQNPHKKSQEFQTTFLKTKKPSKRTIKN